MSACTPQPTFWADDERFVFTFLVAFAIVIVLVMSNFISCMLYWRYRQSSRLRYDQLWSVLKRTRRQTAQAHQVSRNEQIEVIDNVPPTIWPNRPPPRPPMVAVLKQRPAPPSDSEHDSLDDIALTDSELQHGYAKY